MHLSLPELKDTRRWVLNLENESTYTHTHTLRIPRMSRDPIGSNNAVDTKSGGVTFTKSKQECCH